jgi:DNA-binding transcriptional ArsR family regulator
MGREFKPTDARPVETTNSVLEVFQALSHPVRLEICQLLMLRQYSVGELCGILDLKQYAVSQQLAVLRKAEIVATRRDARHIIYFLSNDKVRRILRVSIANLGLAAEQSDIAELDRKQQAGAFARVR